MVTTHHIDELLESLGPKEWVLAEMIGLDKDFDAFYRFRDELLPTRRGDWAAVYRGELICVAHGPAEIYEELRRRNIPTWRAVIRAIVPDRPLRLPISR
jgi:hypothetical protein